MSAWGFVYQGLPGYMACSTCVLYTSSAAMPSKALQEPSMNENAILSAMSMLCVHYKSSKVAQAHALYQLSIQLKIRSPSSILTHYAPHAEA